MMKWSHEETEKLLQMRKVLHKELECRKQLPDVVGDRRLLRFLRGHGQNVEKACKMYAKFLSWRDEHDVDDIRDHIVYGKLTSPNEFPCGRKILRLVPQMMIAHDALDICGNPIALEHFNFMPEIVLREITKKEYITFMIYTLEYKILLLEQMADEREKIYLDSNPPENVPYGIILSSRVIRDLNGFGLGHIGTDGQTVIKWILELAVDNYPELLFKCHMINVPWIFNSIWFFMKGLMDPNTVKKVTITGADYYKGLLKEIPIECIPTAIGGEYEPKNILYTFNTDKDGPFYYIGCENYIERVRSFDENEIENGAHNHKLERQYSLDNTNMRKMKTVKSMRKMINDGELERRYSGETDKDDSENEETKTEKIKGKNGKNREIGDIGGVRGRKGDQVERCDKYERGENGEPMVRNESEQYPYVDFDHDSNCGSPRKDPENENTENRNNTDSNYVSPINTNKNRDKVQFDLPENGKKKENASSLLVTKNNEKDMKGKNEIQTSNKMMMTGMKISHILKIESIVKGGERFLETRTRRIEERRSDSPTAVRKTKKSTLRCTDVGIMSSEKNCKISCSIQ